MKDILSILGIQNIVWLSGAIAVLITTIVQGLSNKYKPWTYIATQIGKAINKETLEKLDVLEKKVNEIEKCDREQDRKQEEEKVKAARRRILRFSDEIRAKVRHSKELFDNVLEDISFYRNYCDVHDEFENEKAVMAIELIEEVYKKCYRENDFL